MSGHPCLVIVVYASVRSLICSFALESFTLDVATRLAQSSYAAGYTQLPLLVWFSSGVILIYRRVREDSLSLGSSKILPLSFWNRLEVSFAFRMPID